MKLERIMRAGCLVYIIILVLLIWGAIDIAKCIQERGIKNIVENVWNGQDSTMVDTTIVIVDTLQTILIK